MGDLLYKMLTVVSKVEPLNLAIFFLGVMGLGALWLGSLALKNRGRK
jgi:hypothetical protein